MRQVDSLREAITNSFSHTLFLTDAEIEKVDEIEERVIAFIKRVSKEEGQTVEGLVKRICECSNEK